MGTVATLILAELPSLIAMMKGLIALASSDPGTPEELSKKLDDISADLASIDAKVQAAELPDKQ